MIRADVVVLPHGDPAVVAGLRALEAVARTLVAGDGHRFVAGMAAREATFVRSALAPDTGRTPRATARADDRLVTVETIDLEHLAVAVATVADRGVPAETSEGLHHWLRAGDVAYPDVAVWFRQRCRVIDEILRLDHGPDLVVIERLHRGYPTVLARRDPSLRPEERAAHDRIARRIRIVTGPVPEDAPPRRWRMPWRARPWLPQVSAW